MLPRFIVFLILTAFFFSSASFGLTLRESIEIAMKSNPEIRAHAAKIKGTESRVRQVISTFYPTIVLDGAYGRSYRTPIEYTYYPTAETTVTTEVNAPYIDIKITPETTIAPITLESYKDEPHTARNIGLAFTQKLFSGGKRIHQLRAAQASLRIAEEESKRRRQLLTYRVVEAYYGVVLRKKMLELASSSEKLAKTHLDQALNYFRFGRISNADVLRARLRLAQEKFNKIEAQNKLDEAKVGLNEILGRSVDEAIEIEENKAERPLVSLPGSEELFTLALENRPEWEAYRYREEIGKRGVEMARADFFPTLALHGSISKSYLDPDTPPENETEGILRSDSWFLYGVFSWNVFDGFRTQNRVKEAEAGMEEIATYEEQIKNRILSEIKEARLYFEAARSKIPVAKEQVDLAEENLRQALESYRGGVVGNIEFLEAQRILNQAKTDLLHSETGLEIAKAKFNLAVGKEVFALY